MKKLLPALALAAAATLPLAVSAQSPAPASDARAQMMQMRDATRTAAFNDLSADHRTRVQAIVNAVNSGQQTDVRAAADQIEAILSPDEQKAVLAERMKMMQTIRANHPDGMGGPGGPGMGGPGGPGMGGPPPGGPGMPDGRPINRRGPSAGRALLQLAVSPEKMRALRGGHGGPMPQGSAQPR